MLIISNTVEVVRLAPDDVVCIEADGNYSTLHIAGEEERTVLFQLGQLERMMSEQLGEKAAVFIRIGRGLIINRNYIYYINPNRSLLVMRDPMGHRYSMTKASHESLKKLKELVEVDMERKTNDE